MSNTQGCPFPGRAALAVLLLTLTAAGSAPADEARWTPLGLDGGEAITLAAPGTGIVYAGSSGGGVFLSRDRGETWSPAADGLLATYIYALESAPDGSLYAGTDAGLYHLADGTSRWQRLGEQDFEGDFVGSVAVDPADPQTLYATVARGRISGVWSIYRSQDGGRSFTDISDGLLFSRLLAVIPGEPSTLLAPSTSGTWRLETGGSGWERFDAGLPGPAFFESLAQDPAAPGTLYAAIWDREQVEPYKSVDGGRSWTRVAQGLPQADGFESQGSIALDPSVSPNAPGTVYFGDSTGVFRSSDGGASWQPAGAPADRPVESLAVDAGDGTVLAGLDVSGRESLDVVLRSTDRGDTWQAFSDGFRGSSVIGLWPDPELAGRLLASTTYQGLRETLDDGTTWGPSMEGIEEDAVGPIVPDPSSPGALFVTAGPTSNQLHRVYGSRDSGRTWQALGEPFAEVVHSLTVDPGREGVVFASSGGRVWESLDDGETWQDVSGRICGDVLDLSPPTPSGRLFAGCVEDSGAPVSPPIFVSFVLRSLDAGRTWQRMVDGPSGSVTGTWSFSLDPSSPAGLFAFLKAFDGGASLRSSDGGSTWTAIEGLAFEPVTSLVANPLRPQELWAGSAERGVLRSADDGQTWTPRVEGLVSGRVEALVFDPHRDDVLWAGTGGGVHVLETPPSPCRATADGLCLMNRFTVEVSWEDFEGRLGPGRGTSLGPNTGTFWFFNDGNTELAIKILDGRGINGHFWVFYGALTNVGYSITVTDELTGEVRTYQNPVGRLEARADTEAFPDDGAAFLPAPGSDPSTALAGASAKSPLSLLDDRFRIGVAWRGADAAGGTGTGVSLSEESGYFWFFEPENLELFVKILDGRAINGRYWIFFTALTDLGFDLEVTDLATGEVKTYTRSPGVPGSRLDLELF